MTRTSDLMVNSHALYLLSYRGSPEDEQASIEEHPVVFFSLRLFVKLLSDVYSVIVLNI